MATRIGAGSYGDFKTALSWVGPGSPLAPTLVYYSPSSGTVTSVLAVGQGGEMTVRGEDLSVAQATVLADFPSALPMDYQFTFTNTA